MNYLVLSTVEVCDTLSRQLAYVNLPHWIDTEGSHIESNKTIYDGSQMIKFLVLVFRSLADESFELDSVVTTKEAHITTM